ncbi:MAG: hypothetical protein ACTSUT_12580 [Promethearchaeota archaeon]
MVIFNVNEIKKELKEKEELTPIIKFLENFSCDYELKRPALQDNKFFIEKAKEFKKLMENNMVIKGIRIKNCSSDGRDCPDCGRGCEDEFYGLEGWEPDEFICRACLCDYLITQNRTVC